MPQKLITVFGATGAQGSSVLRSLSRNNTTPFALRATTRHTSSSASKILLKQVPHTELVEADGWNKASMVAAFRGSWGAFVNTNSDDAVFETPDETRTEIDLGKIIVDAAIEAGVEVLMYSGFNSAKEITGGEVANKAFDDKNAIGEYAKSTNAFKAVIIVGAGWYFENFLSRDMAPVFGGFPYIPAEDGALVLRVPKWGGSEDVPFISIGDDFGDIVHGVFLEPEKWDGRLVQAVSDIKSFDKVVASFEQATGKKARFEEVVKWQDLEVYGVRALETVKLMFGFCQQSGGRYFGDKTEAETAQELKKRAVEACGLSGDVAKLQDLEHFFAQRFDTPTN
ncbi:NAD(P)-binding protein [Ophiobolus disseminans]|uniref:NAD(P)-binding protein n=1 Tax=Ophiobolus disseminans TaxID=1469910 RepID=A0A6A6ZMH7_9PLEO|nr:NAD(P)-binding protein [Ophiobolus disseminans]